MVAMTATDKQKERTKMGNMSYCRFQNTLGDLRDCRNNMYEDLDRMSSDEKRAHQNLVKLCKSIVNESFDDVLAEMKDEYLEKFTAQYETYKIQMSGMDDLVLSKEAYIETCMEEHFGEED